MSQKNLEKITGIGWDGREVNTTNLLTIQLWKFSIGHEQKNVCNKIILKHPQWVYTKLSHTKLHFKSRSIFLLIINMSKQLTSCSERAHKSDYCLTQKDKFKMDQS